MFATSQGLLDGSGWVIKFLGGKKVPGADGRVPRASSAADVDTNYLNKGKSRQGAGMGTRKAISLLRVDFYHRAGFLQSFRYPPNFSLVHHIGATNISRILLNQHNHHHHHLLERSGSSSKPGLPGNRLLERSGSSSKPGVLGNTGNNLASRTRSSNTRLRLDWHFSFPRLSSTRLLLFHSYFLGFEKPKNREK